MIPHKETVLARDPFWSLLEFRIDDAIDRPALLLVPPVSGQFAVLTRDLVIDLMADFRVLVGDWHNLRHVPLAQGSFDLDENIGAVLRMLRHAGPRPFCLGLCQGGVASLAAASLLSMEDDDATPIALALMAAPIDPAAGPTRLSRMLGLLPSRFFDKLIAGTVPSRYVGHGRRVYPAEPHLWALRAYLYRDALSGGEMLRKLAQDDGLDCDRFPFLGLYSSVMDLDLAFVRQNNDVVFRRRALATGELCWRDTPVEPRALRKSALITVEGGLDRVAGTGQTSAAHMLCTDVPQAHHHHLRFERAGHFSLFHGGLCREAISPALRRALLSSAA